MLAAASAFSPADTATELKEMLARRAVNPAVRTAQARRMHASGKYTIAELMEVFAIGRATVYRVLDRAKQRDSP